MCTYVYTPPSPTTVALSDGETLLPPFEREGWVRHTSEEPLVAGTTRWMVGQGDMDQEGGNSTQAVVFTRGTV